MKANRLIPAAVAAAALLAPAAASADSIVYLDGAAVWSAAPDGSHKVQLSDTGMYHSVTQSDDGTIAAARGPAIDILARDGRLLRSISTVPAKTGNGGDHRGTPDSLAFSPDGSKIAYEYTDFACPPASTCTIQHSVFYTTVQGPDASPHKTYGQQFGRQTPSFVTNDRAVIFGGHGSAVNIDPLGGGDSSDDLWYTNDTDWADGEVSRDGSRFVVEFGYGENTRLGFLRVNGDPRTGIPAAPTTGDTVCETTPDEQLNGASWAPDGAGVAYGSKDGIEIVRFSAFEPGNCGVSGQSVLAPTGKSPDWGPADPPARAYEEDVAQGPGTGGGGAGGGGGEQPGNGDGTPAQGGGGGVTSPGGVRIKVPALTRSVLRRGLTVKVTVAAPGKIAVRLADGRRTVAAGRATARRAGTIRVRLARVKRATADRLRGKRLRLTVKTAAGTATRTLRVR